MNWIEIGEPDCDLTVSGNEGGVPSGDIETIDDISDGFLESITADITLEKRITHEIRLELEKNGKDKDGDGQPDTTSENEPTSNNSEKKPSLEYKVGSRVREGMEVIPVEGGFLKPGDDGTYIFEEADYDAYIPNDQITSSLDTDNETIEGIVSIVISPIYPAATMIGLHSLANSNAKHDILSKYLDKGYLNGIYCKHNMVIRSKYSMAMWVNYYDARSGNLLGTTVY